MVQIIFFSLRSKKLILLESYGQPEQEPILQSSSPSRLIEEGLEWGTLHIEHMGRDVFIVAFHSSLIVSI